MRKFLCAIFLLLIPALSGRAQFYDAGNDPASARYMQIRTDNFRIIYPVGADSLARIYAASLEMQLPRVAASSGYSSNELCSKPLPVVLRSFTGYANGMMMWAPRRMELFTVGDPYEPDAMPWVQNLTIHEQRHSTQLQFSRRGIFKAARFVAGDLSDVAWWAAYPGIAYSEGDAVAAETGLSKFGRGRSADFLEYVRVCFDSGDWRDWYRWRYGSQRLFTPDHYRAGYLLAAGARYSWDVPDFSARYYSTIFDSKLPFPFAVMQKTVRGLSGMGFKDSFQAISEGFQEVWAENDSLRAPFLTSSAVTEAGRRFTELEGAAMVDGCIFAIENGLERAARLLKISKSGEVLGAIPFASMTSALKYSGADGRLYWSEHRADIRWGLKSSSAICFMDVREGTRGTLLKGGRYYNPVPSPDGRTLAVAEYPLDGSSLLLLVDTATGTTSQSIKAPDGMQIVEPVWLDGSIFVSAITDDGFGIFNASDGFCCFLSPAAAKIKQLQAHDGRLCFVSDRNGADELYSYDGRELVRLTSLRHGGEDFLFDDSGRQLYFTELSPEGRTLRHLCTDALVSEVCNPQEIWKNPVAETLTAQESALGVSASPALESFIDSVTISEPERYRKAAHLLRLHSWAPVHFDYDAVESLSFDSFDHIGNLGAMLFLQNDLATASGVAGYSARPRADGSWEHAVDLKFDYTGLFPVIETSLLLDNNGSRDYRYLHMSGSKGVRDAIATEQGGALGFSFNTKVYVPLSFSSGGWSRGVVPQITYSISNNGFDASTVHTSYDGVFDSIRQRWTVTGVDPSTTAPVQSLNLSVRAWSMLPVAKSGVYPRLGIGAEAGIGGRPALTGIYAPSAYGYLYGYLPGIIPQHGVRLSVLAQKQLRPQDAVFGEQRANVIPRGFAAVSGSLGSALAIKFPVQAKLSADYKMAVLPLDWSGLGPIAYVRNFEAGMHLDYLALNGSGSRCKASSNTVGVLRGGDGGGLMSVGASLAVRLGNLLCVPFDTRIGVSWSYNCGPSFDDFRNSGLPLERHYAGMTFSIDY